MDEQVAEVVVSKLRIPWVPPTISGALGIVIGAGAATFWHKRKLSRLIEQIAEDTRSIEAERLLLSEEREQKEREFHEAIREATRMTKELQQLGVDVVSNLEGLRVTDVAAGKAHLEVERIVQPENPDVVDETESVVVNVFDDGDDTWDYEAERSSRTREQPYIIHVDEFVADEMGYESQTTLTWYEKDQILTDSKDIPIYDPHRVVGELRFGHGSKDQNIVYVRNEMLKAEYEILRDTGSYQETVLGETFEKTHLRHANEPRRFRNTD